MFDIRHISEYKVGSNQYKSKRKGFMDLKPKTWLSLLIIFLILAMIETFFFVFNQYDKKISMFNDIAYAKVKIPSPTPRLTQKDIIFSKKHGDIIYRIWTEESSQGKQTFLYCEHKGLHNDFGFNVLNKQCFSTFNDEVNAVERWIEDHDEMKLGQMLCLYNEGNPEHECTYTHNFLGI